MQTLEELEAEREIAVLKLHEAQYEIHRIDSCIQFIKQMPPEHIKKLQEATLSTISLPSQTKKSAIKKSEAQAQQQAATQAALSKENNADARTPPNIKDPKRIRPEDYRAAPVGIQTNMPLEALNPFGIKVPGIRKGGE